MIYLDNNATTPVAAEVAKKVCTCLRECFGNPSSSHPEGIKARKAVTKAREQVASLIGAKPEEIVFTSGGTESNNMAIVGTALRFRTGQIITSSIEHPSVSNPLKYLEGLGYKVIYAPVDTNGRVSADFIKNKINRKTILITIMHSNNETGSIQPIAAIGKIARHKGVTFHCDAAQSVGKVPIHVKNLHVDLLTVVSHKFYGPKGTGALYIRSGVDLRPVTFGASHEKGLRPGTENVAGIAGLGMACSLAQKEMQNRVETMKGLSGKFIAILKKDIPQLKLNGHPSKRLPNTLNLSFPGVSGSVLLDKLKSDIAASTGSACHEGQHSPSAVLKAMGVSDEDALSAVRISLGRTNTEAQIMRAAKLFVKAYRSLSIKQS